MPLNYHPKAGEILLCDYTTGFVAPEMIKRRPVIVVSPRLRRRSGLATVVPLSTTAPVPAEAHHCAIQLPDPLPKPFDAPFMWAKCDMLATLSLKRFDRFRARTAQGQRTYVSAQLSPAQIQAVRSAILAGLGLTALTKFL